MSTAAADVQRPAAPTGDGELTHRQILTVLGGLMLGMFLAALDQTVVSTAIRTIADDLSGLSLQAWATTAFLITSTITLSMRGPMSLTKDSMHFDRWVSMLVWAPSEPPWPRWWSQPS